MEHYKISKISKHSTVSKYEIRKCSEVNDLSGGQYFVNKNIRFKPPMLRLDLCDYMDAYIVVKERIVVEGTSNANKRNKRSNLPE